jgi:hypothetical protein
LNSSFTLWYKKAKESEDIPSVEIHLNLWINNDVLIIKSPSNNKENKKFLGYDWSSSKGKEGS